jgi:hypothetical protein
MVKWANVRSKQLLEIKGIRCIHLKVLMIKCDTYHDTWTNYLMKQEPLLIQDQTNGDVVVANKIKTMEEEKVGPQGPCSGQSYSQYSMSRTCGPRDMIS